MIILDTDLQDENAKRITKQILYVCHNSLDRIKLRETRKHVMDIFRIISVMILDKL